jgi:hypothetical protein
MKPTIGMSQGTDNSDHVALQKKILYKLKLLIKIGITAKELSEDVKKSFLSTQGRTITLPQFYSRFWNHPTELDPEPF